MSPEDFLRSLGMDPNQRGNSDEQNADGGSSDGGSSDSDSSQQTASTDQTQREFPVPAGDQKRHAFGPPVAAAATATAATAAVAMHKGRHADRTDGSGTGRDDSTRPSPVADGRPRPTPAGRPRPTPSAGQQDGQGFGDQPYQPQNQQDFADRPYQPQGAPQPVGASSGPAPQPTPGPGAVAPQAPGNGAAPTSTLPASNGFGSPNADGPANAKSDQAGSRRGMFSALRRRGDR
jgi:hypothetical protein